MKWAKSIRQRKVKAIHDIIARGERAIRDGRVISHEKAKKRLARWSN
jgi:hypothetical protein